MSGGEERLARALAELRLDPPVHEHPPVATVAEAHAHWAALAAAPVKNLFLKDAGGAYWLVVADAERRIDLKALPAMIGAKRLRFASADDLLATLGVEPGAVSPLAAVNDPEHRVRIVVDAALADGRPLALHPLRNTATLALPFDALVRLLALTGHAPVLLPSRTD